MINKINFRWVLLIFLIALIAFFYDKLAYDRDMKLYEELERSKDAGTGNRLRG